jgi:tetratricopeptide (TPR) repeat protein
MRACEARSRWPAAIALAGLLWAGPAQAQPAAPSPGPAPSSPPAADTARRPPTLDKGLNAAFRLIRAGRYAEARQAAEAYLAGGAAAHPGQAQFILGLSYHRQRLYEAAHGHFVRATELEPGYVTARFFHGFTLLNLGRLDEARKELETYLAHGPEDPEAVFGLGLVALEQDRVDDAEQSILRAIALAQARAGPSAAAPDAREDLSRYHARLGDVHLRRGDLAKARADLERSVELWPDHFEPWHKLAGVLRRLGDAAGADRAQARSEEAFRRRMARGRP